VKERVSHLRQLRFDPVGTTTEAAMNVKQSVRERKLYMTAPKPEEEVKRRPNGKVTDILDPNNQIGVKLRSLYAAAQDEAIPDRFLDLLEKLDQVEQRMASAKMAE
jgi:hypothetical protein